MSPDRKSRKFKLCCGSKESKSSNNDERKLGMDPMEISDLEPLAKLEGQHGDLPVDYDQLNKFTRLLFISFSVFLIFITLPLSLICCLKVIQEYERAAIFRLGRLLRGDARGPGIIITLPCVDSFKKIDLRTVSYQVPPQEILSKDSVTVSVDAVVHFRTSDPIASIKNVDDAIYSTKLLAQTTLRSALGIKTLTEMLTDRDEIAHMTLTTLDEATENWGIKVERVEVKDIRLPHNLTRAMAVEAEAARTARAKVVAAEGEEKASHSLKDAADMLSPCPTAVQLRHLQALSSIAQEHSSTIVYPVLMEFSTAFGQFDPKVKNQ